MHTLDVVWAVVERDGRIAESSQRMRPRPALVELRQQRIAFARTVSAMQLQYGLADSTGVKPAAAPHSTQRQPGAKGVFAIGAGRS